MSKATKMAQSAKNMIRNEAQNIAEYAGCEEEFRQLFEELVRFEKAAQGNEYVSSTVQDIRAVEQVLVTLSANINKRDMGIYLALMRYLCDVDAVFDEVVRQLFTNLCSAMACGDISASERAALRPLESVVFG